MEKNSKEYKWRFALCCGSKECVIVIPDHKVCFVPMQSEDEAAYLTAFLNSRMVSDAISAYASALSLGTSVTDYLIAETQDRRMCSSPFFHFGTT